jgi:hypothetical protein
MGGRPTNISKQSCNPVSSNCVIWQGPDIECIDLCTGDNISDVVAKLATELCGLMDMFNLSNYDLTCLEECPTPGNFVQLIQLLIERICECCNVDPVTPTDDDGCPDCVVNIASCFYYQNPQGDTVTTMQLTDYVTAIGNKVCDLVTQVNTLTNAISDLTERVEALEEAEEQVSLRVAQITTTVTPSCINNGNTDPMEITEFVTLLEQQFCELRIATGLPNDIFKAIVSQTPNIINEKTLSGTGNMGSLQGWVANPKNAADTINNIWLTISDMRAAVKSMKATCCGNGCDNIELAILATMNGNTLNLFINGYIPQGFIECTPAGTLITVTDTTGAFFTTNLVLPAVLNAPNGIQIDLSNSSLNTALDFTLVANVCLKNTETGTICQSLPQYVLSNTLTCPDPVTLTPTTDTIGYSFTHITGSVTYTVSLYDGSGTTLISSQSHITTDPATISGSFDSLSSGTAFRVQISIAAGTKTNTCAFMVTSTTGAPCNPPTDVNAILTI